MAREAFRPLRRGEYERLVEMGVFDDEHVELLFGTLVTMTPPGPQHADVNTRLGELLTIALAGRARVRVQMPLALLEDSEPQPDLAVVPASRYSQAHPTRAFLVVEISHSSLRLDRDVKAALYAKAGVPEYWLINLRDGTVEVRSEPSNGVYSTLVTHREGSIHPQAFPDVTVSLAELFAG